jgi:hypothetical protein
MKATRQIETEITKEKARKLSAMGLTVREVGRVIGKSHTWVANTLKETPVDNSNLTKNLQGVI